MRVTKEIVIQTASDLVDQEGLNNLSLKIIAEKLNIRTPSLYNHISSMDSLLREIAHKGMGLMNEQMIQAAIGTSGDSAIKAIGTAYFKFAVAHPGVYETIQWATWHGSNKTIKIFESYKDLLVKLIDSCDLKRARTDEILNLLTGVLHGYTTMQLGRAAGDLEVAIGGLTEALDTVLLGVYQKYN